MKHHALFFFLLLFQPSRLLLKHSGTTGWSIMQNVTDVVIHHIHYQRPETLASICLFSSFTSNKMTISTSHVPLIQYAKNKLPSSPIKCIKVHFIQLILRNIYWLSTICQNFTNFIILKITLKGRHWYTQLIDVHRG